MTRICYNCKKEKDITEFNKSKSEKLGYGYLCKLCSRKESKLYQKKNKEKIAKRKHKYNKENKDKIKKQDRQWYLNGGKEYYKKRRELNKDYFRDKQLQRNYNITLEQYNNLRIKQNHKCLICGRDELEINDNINQYNDKKNKLVVDHSHEIGIIRGLLCRKCNLLLGHANDNIQILQNAIKYLEKNDD